MVLRFKKIKLHNFGSYSNADIDLCDRGFCLVSGENHCVKDGAVSNGSGKSTIWSAICYALTGETINGLTNNLKNINVEEDDCFVTLDFEADADAYSVTRTYKPKSDLKVVKNDVDISGKGVRESERVLETNLPDLTKDLIASTIILGQGMPNKFSSFNPSGRKALLEKLTKSDFMIEDIRTRISDRQAEVGKAIQEYANSILVNSTNLANAEDGLLKANAELEALSKRDYDVEIAALTETLKTVTDEIAAENAKASDIEAQSATAADELMSLSGRRANDMAELNESYSKSVDKDTASKYQLEAEIRSKGAELRKLQSITDVCPTCHQKLPDIHKPDTSALEAEVAELTKELNSTYAALNEADAKYKEYKAKVDGEYSTAIDDLQKRISDYKKDAAVHKLKATSLSAKAKADNEELIKAQVSKESFLKQTAAISTQIASYEKAIVGLKNAIAVTEAAKTDMEGHLVVLKRMTSLTQREFRGYLLEDIIKYIDKRAKDYCEIVFGTRELNVYLDGNALDISYCGKLFDSLSGGEKQRCDVILQFAIRDLLQNYLNYSSNILVLDEIFDGLDRLSTERIIDLISTSLKDVESTFVISHHSDELELPIDSEIRVVKNVNGISEVR